MVVRTYRHLLVLTSALAGQAFAAPVSAQAHRAEAVSHAYNIPAGPLTVALSRFAETSGVQLSYDAALAYERVTRGLHGQHRTSEALSDLLEGTGLSWRFVDERTVTLEPARRGSLMLDTVTVRPSRMAETSETDRGATAGDDQSRGRDTIIVTAPSEDSKLYSVPMVSGATRLGLSPRETPQSLSVITRMQIEDFTLRNAADVLASTTGVNVQRVETERTYYTARGFEITNFQMDGIGLPFSIGYQFGDTDTAPYDRIEVLRGANGLLSSTGNPSATVNFVRKKPKHGFGASATASYGSWDDKRIDADISTPLTTDGSVRLRVVGAVQDRDSYLDRYTQTKKIGYAVVEWAPSPDTTIDLGYLRQHNDSRGGMWGALPLYYTDGTPTDYVRSTSTSANWSMVASFDSQGFVEAEQKLGSDWVARLAVQRRLIKARANLFYVGGVPDHATGAGLIAYPSYYQDYSRQWIADAYVMGGFTLFGRRHDLVVGGNWARDAKYHQSDSAAAVTLTEATAFGAATPPLAFDAGMGFGDFVNRRVTGYAVVRLNPADPLRVIAGANITHVTSRGQDYGEVHEFSRTKASPYVGAVLDLTTSLSAYASYTSIFSPQQQLTATKALLDPIEGSNLEAGLKGAFLNGRLNASAAIFCVKQNNLAEYAGYDAANSFSFYRAINARSEGVEFDLSGEVAKGLQLNAGFTALRIKDADGNATRTYVPRRTVKLSASYAPAFLPKLKLGTEVQWQSDIYRDQGALDTSGREIISRQNGYALVDLMARYALTERVELGVNAYNVTDHKYITSLINPQAYFGAPASVMGSIGVKF